MEFELDCARIQLAIALHHLHSGASHIDPFWSWEAEVAALEHDIHVMEEGIKLGLTSFNETVNVLFSR